MWYSACMKKHVVLEKQVGQTPLQCSDLYKKNHPELQDIKTTYAGRLDPMASGKLLVLLGEECKKKEQYLNLDKEYKFEILFGVRSDTGDVLGRLNEGNSTAISEADCRAVTKTLTGKIQLPYPHFSSKTVHGKPLHTWTLEGKISEIEIPTKKSVIHSLKCTKVYTQTRVEVHHYATTRIETIPPVTDLRKSIGNDFRRDDIRKDWEQFLDTGSPEDTFYIAKFTCIASSGTYMRTLGEVIAKELDMYGLAYSIHRTKIGIYKKIPIINGVWATQYR